MVIRKKLLASNRIREAGISCFFSNRSSGTVPKRHLREFELEPGPSIL